MFTKLVKMLGKYKDSQQKQQQHLEDIKNWININFNAVSNEIVFDFQKFTSINVDQNKLSQHLAGNNNILKESLLHLAVRYDNAELLKWLLYTFDDINVNYRDAEGFTPWLRAVQLENTASAEILKKHTMHDPFAANNLGENAAHFMIGFLTQWEYYKTWLPETNDKKIGAEKIFVELIKNSRTKQSKNILHYALSRKQVTPEIIQQLCKIDPKFMFEADSKGITPIFYAIEHLQDNDLPAIIDVLIKSIPWHTANKGLIEYKNKEGYTPWLWAIKSGKLNAAKCLKAYKANVLCENNIGENAAHLIVEHLNPSLSINRRKPSIFAFS